MNRIQLPEAWQRRAIVISGEPDQTWLSESERAAAEAFRAPKRRAEWMLSRIAAKQLAIELGLCASASECVIDRPRMFVGGRQLEAHVSLSHSHGYAAAALDRTAVGVDAERIREIKTAAAHLFLAEEEIDAALSCRCQHALLHFWAAKEAAWKQREGAIETLKKVPLKLEAETATGLRFDIVETIVTGEIVVALTLPTS